MRSLVDNRGSAYNHSKPRWPHRPDQSHDVHTPILITIVKCLTLFIFAVLCYNNDLQIGTTRKYAMRSALPF